MTMPAKTSRLKELSGLLTRHPGFNEKFLRDQVETVNDPAALETAVAMLIAAYYQSNRLDKAFDALERVERKLGMLPVSLFVLRGELLLALGMPDRVPLEYLEYGCRWFDAGQHLAGIEAISTAFVFDVSKGYHHILHDPDLVRQGVDRYEQMAALMQKPVRGCSSNDGRIRVGMLVPNLADGIVAYSNRVLYFGRFIDHRRYDLRVYVTENMATGYGRFPLQFGCPATPVRAPKALAELSARNIPVVIGPTSGGIMVRAQWMADRMAQDALDMLIVQSGPTMPIDWLAARKVPVPVKLQIHIGFSAMMRGMDATLFDNAVNMEREAQHWPSFAGERILMRRGTDIDAIDAVPALDRADVGLPRDAVIMGTLSNHLDKRVSSGCVAVLCRVLQAVPGSWYVGIGGKGMPAHLETAFREAHVLDRVRFFPSSKRPAEYLKLLDVYVNEFPSGGSQSVVEAMVCGLPVVAMRAGNTHHESVGADIVGSPYAIETNDPVACEQRLIDWMTRPLERSSVGCAMRKRAMDEYSIRDYVQRVCTYGAERLRNVVQNVAA